MSGRRPSIVIALTAALLSAGVLSGVILPPAAYAAQTVSSKVGKPLQEAQAAAKNRDFDGAIAKAKEAQAIAGKTAYEDFVINDFLAYCYNSKRDYRNALAASEAALSYSGLAKADKGKRIKTLAQLAYQIKDYGKTITYANRYLSEVGADPDLQLLVASCYYQQRNYTQALATSKAIVDAADSAGRAPSKQALAMFLSSAFQLKETASIKRALFRLVELYPSDAYWDTLIKQIGNQSGMGDYVSLDVQRLRLKLNLAKSGDEYFNTGKFAFALNLPGDAKAILAEGFAKKLLGSAASDRDQRLQGLVETAATKDLANLPADDAAAAKGTAGDADILVGQRYASFGQFDKAVEAINRGLAKTGVTNPDQAHLELGRILLAAKKTDAARKALQSIKTDGPTKDVARLYLIGG